jgi:2,3-dihydroxybenzoate-AMP ligase
MLEGFVPWPKEFAERYRREGYWLGESLGDLLRPWAARGDSRTAVVTEGHRWTYADLDRTADRLAAGLRKLGLRFADRVVVQLPNRVEFVTLSIALFRIGVLPIFALPAHRLNEITYLCEASDACALFIADHNHGFDYLPLAAEVQRRTHVRHIVVAGEPGGFLALNDINESPEDSPAPKPEDIAFFLLSGGTTGLPKLIPRTHDDYNWQLRATAEAVRFDANSAYLAALPVAHNAALGCPGILGALRAGGRAVLAASPSPDDVFPLIAAERVTVTTLMPSLLSIWAEAAPLAGMDLSGLLIEVGGAKLSPETAHHVMQTLSCRLMHWFGMAEGPLCHTAWDDPSDVIAHTQGWPLCAADELRVVDESDREVAPGEVGNLLFRGPTTLRGYYAAAQYNAAAFTADGFLRTGDLVRLTSERRLVAEGRIKDTINRGGEKISAEELEGHLLAHHAIQHVAVVPVPDEAMGEKIFAFIVSDDRSLSRMELKQFLQQSGVADYKAPDRIELVEALPYTELGKVDKKVLRQSLAQRNG